MNKKRVICASAAVLTACGGGVGSSPLDDTALQARWEQNIAQVAQVRSAIDNCAASSDGVLAGRCDTLVLLTSRDFLPRTYTLVASRFESAAPVIVRGTGEIVLAGNEEAGNCTVTETMISTPSGLLWGYKYERNTRCEGAISTRLRWSDNIAYTARMRTAIEECSKKSGGVLAGNCDSIAALTANDVLPHGFVIWATPFLASATITARSAAVVLYGTWPMGACVVTITPTVAGKGVTWTYTNSSAEVTPDDGKKCDRTITGVGT